MGTNRKIMPSNETRIYVGNLPPDIRTKDIEDLFYKYGKIIFIDLKNRRGPPFAFVEFEDARDADDAVYARDGYDYDGYKLRVEFPRGGGGSFRGGGGYRGDRRPGPPARRSQYRVMVTGLPPTGSWQDLKDHMRDAGDVCYSDVYKDGIGVVEYMRREDMKYALKKLDDTKFKSHEGETSYIRVREDDGTADSSRSSRSERRRSNSRSKSPRKSRGSPRYSPLRKTDSRSRSRERNKSGSGHSRKKSPSTEKSRTRS